MSTRAEWLDRNGEFLTASVSWIRDLLRQHSRSRPDALPAAVVVPRRRSRWGRDDDTPPSRPELTGRSVDGPPALAAAIDTAAQEDPPPALVRLAQAAGLSRFERDVLLLCVAVELDPSIRDLAADVHGNSGMGYPTFALALAVLPDPAWEALAPDAPLRALRLLEVNRPWGESLISSPLRTDERIVNHLKGLDHLDARLRGLLRPVSAVDEALLPPSQQAAVEVIAAGWADGAVVQLVGPDPASASLVAAAAAARAGLDLYRTSDALLPQSPDDLEELARLWRREALLSPLALCLDVDGAADAALGFAGRAGTPLLVRARESVPQLATGGPVIDVDPPTVAERRDAWTAHLPADTTVDAGALAAQFALDTATIAAAAQDPDPWARCRVLTRPHVDGYAHRLQPTVGWDDLVLGQTETRLLRGIADQVRHRWQVYDEWGFAAKSARGLGLSALFAGPSGVGKTLAAEVLAHELGLDLYRADLSAVMSKYIGETEKNLRKLFDAAESGGWLLFFDEADALFGKRSEVTNAHDRYANVQVDYLLQRMETYRGLAILSTNMRSALDTAFLRRLRFVVEFPFPDIAQRRAIWARAFPPDVPGIDTLDLDRLASLPTSGAMIHNIALNAAFLASARGGHVDAGVVERAVRDEFAKMQLPLRDRDLAGSR